MRPVYFLIFILNFSILCYANSLLDSGPNSNTQDRYQNFEELNISEKEGIDFRIVTQDLNNSITVLAPHGGRIELGTSEIAQAIAGSKFNLYLFEGIKSQGNFDLHVTSSHFDEPRAIRILAKSKLGISIHGFKEDQVELVEVGGLNLKAGRLVTQALSDLGIRVQFPSRRFQGNSPDNIVNKAKYAGVQLELSSRLRHNLTQNPTRLDGFSKAIQDSLEDANPLDENLQN